MGEKFDIKREFSSLYRPRAGEFVDVEVPEFTYVKVDGHGDPNCSSDYAEAVQALYAVSYAMKFDAKLHLQRDYVVPPLEGLWWAEDPAAFTERRKDAWFWTMMILVPDFVTQQMFAAARDKAQLKKGPLPASLRCEALAEGRALQTLHVGPYEDEGHTLAHLHDEVMPGLGLTFNGPHHEIYLSDPRRTDPKKLKTVLRQPVRPAA